MRNRKICSVLIAIIFAVSVVFSCILLSLIKRIDIKFYVSQERDIAEVADSFEKLKDKFIYSVSEKEINEILNDYPYFYLAEKPKKTFPNVLTLVIRERREIYRLVDGGKSYIMNGNGILLSIEDDRGESRSLITLRLSGLKIKDTVLGQVIGMDDSDLFNIFLETAKQVDLNDNIKSVTISSATERKDIQFVTYTGVTIEIPDANDNGLEKTLVAFNAYNESADDYYKSFDTITAIKKSNGEYNIVWTAKA